MGRWWIDNKIETPEDAKWYRKHMNMSPQGLTNLVEDEYVRRELNTDIVPQLMSCLSELDRRILQLHYIEGLKWREVAEELGYNLSYLWKREKRALAKMRALAESKGLKPHIDKEEE